MAIECAVCASGKREQVDAALLSGIPAAQVSNTFSISAQSVRRHNRNHLLRTGLWPGRVTDSATTSDLIGGVISSMQDAITVRDDARRTGNTRIMLAAIREVRGLAPILDRLGLDDAFVTARLQAYDELIASVQAASKLRPQHARELANAARALRYDDIATDAELLAEHADEYQKSLRGTA